MGALWLKIVNAILFRPLIGDVCNKHDRFGKFRMVPRGQLRGDKPRLDWVSGGGKLPFACMVWWYAELTEPSAHHFHGNSHVPVAMAPEIFRKLYYATWRRTGRNEICPAWGVAMALEIRS